MPDHHVVPGGGQRARDVAREPDFIFNHENVHTIRILLTREILARRNFYAAALPGDQRKVTSLLLFISCLFARRERCTKVLRNRLKK
jgi:hypothetical protein